MLKRIALLAAESLLLLISPGWIANTSANEPVGVIQLEVFVRGDKPSAARVDDYLRTLNQRIQGLEVLRRDVVNDRTQLKRLYELSAKAGRPKPVVPAFHCCDRMVFGFSESENNAPAIEALFTADVYTRNTCPKCDDAKKFIEKLHARWPAIRFRIHEVTNDVIARQRWESLCRGAGAVPGLPTIDFGGHVIIGYQGDEVTGKQLETLIERKSRVETKPESNQKPLDDASSLWWPPSSALMFAALQVDLPTDSIPDPHSNDDELLDLELPDEASDADAGEADLVDSDAIVVGQDESINLPVFGKLRVDDLGMTLFSFLVGIVDGFNPCAMWILVFLLSVLVNIKDRRKIVLIAGTFVLVSGLAYFAFMAAWLNLFLLIGIVRPVQVLLGCLALFIGVINVKDFFAFKKGITLSIPDNQKPGLYRRVRQIVEAKYLTVAIGGAVALAVVVNMIELLCTAGLPALYTQILTLQELPAWQNYALIGVYIFAYMLDDTILLTIVVVTLSHRKLQEREGRWLKLLSGLVILALGIVMIAKPEWLQLVN